MFKTEPHLHTAEVSPCAHLGAAEMIRHYAKAGYRTVFVSDHLKRRYFDALGEKSPKEQFESFFRGYELARETGQRLGLTVLPSAELSLDCSPNHYLLYGFTLDFFLAKRDLFSMTARELCDYAHENGVTVVQAHPYRDGKTEPDVAGIDALEVHNPNPRHENYTVRALAYAEAHGLAITCGSDAHRLEDIARGGVLTEEEIRTPDDYVRLLKQRRLKLIGWEGV